MGRRTLFLLLILLIIYNSCLAAELHTSIPPIILVANQNEIHSLSSGQKNIISKQEMITSGATSLTEVLQNLGGVQLQDITGNGSQVTLNIRGFGVNASSNTLLLINGIPITNPDMAPPDFNAIPLQEIESIEIIAGSESVLYGDQAVGGIVNIITTQRIKDKTDLSCSAGSYSQHNCYVAFNNHYHQLSYGLGFLNQHSDNYRQHNDYGQNQLSGGLDYLYQKGTIGFDYQVANENMLYPGGLTRAQVAQNRRQATNSTDFFKNWNGFYRIHQKQELNADWHLETDFARREMHGNGVLSSPFDQSRIDYFIKPQLKGKLDNVLVTGGIDFEDDHYRISSLFGTTNDSQQKYGLFGLVNIPVTSRLSLSMGARGAQQKSHLNSMVAINNINRALATTLGATFQLATDAKIYLRRAESFRFPKADENSFSSDKGGLKTQKGVSYETGIKWGWKNFLTKVSIYQLNLEREITFDPNQTQQDPFGSNRNLDPTVRRGFSLAEKYQATEKLAIGAQYNYANARFQSGINSGNRIPLVSENFFHAGIHYKITEHWNIYTEASYMGNQYSANDDSNNQGTIGGYTIYNFNLRYQYQHLIVSFRVNNLFNKYYYFYSTFQPGIHNVFFYPAPGRNVLFTIKYELT